MSLSPTLIALLLASAQAALLVPYVVLVPGERANLFTPLLLLVPAVLYAWRIRARARLAAWGPWALLGAGFVGVAFASPEPLPSLWRNLALFVPAAAGVLCGVALSAENRSILWLFRLQTLCFGLLTCAGLAFGAPPFYLGLHHHALAGILVLLSAGPLYYFMTRAGLARWGSGLLLGLGGGLCFLAGSRFLVLLPLVLIPALTLWGRLRLRTALYWLTGALGLAALFFLIYPEKTLRLTNYESVFYRLEGIPASCSIIADHPFTGIGLRTPRRGLLNDYEPRFGIVGKDDYLAVVARNVTTDNQYLTLPVGVGLPLGLLYFALLGRLVWDFFRRGCAVRDPIANALLFPVCATLVHLALYDGLMYPNITWFFHVMVSIGAARGRLFRRGTGTCAPTAGRPGRV